MSVTGLPGQGPVRAGIPLADLTAGLFCALGILTALLEREVSGEGQWVQTSLLEAQIAMLVKVLLPKSDAKSPDAADALAVAITHAQHRGSRELAARVAR